ncbi:MAG: hypothetical protein ACMXYL_01190 [Candidatus Woesearchaeota archaeon]
MVLSFDLLSNPIFYYVIIMIIIIIWIIGGGQVVFYYKVYSLIKKRKIQKISELSIGNKVRVCGRIKSENSLKSPISGSVCAWYSVATELYGARSGSLTWSVQDVNFPVNQFIISDDTGLLTVSPHILRSVSDKEYYYWNPKTNREGAKQISAMIRNYSSLSISPKDEGELTKSQEAGFFKKMISSVRYAEIIARKGDELVLEGIVRVEEGSKILYLEKNFFLWKQYYPMVIPSEKVIIQTKRAIILNSVLPSLVIIVILLITFLYF